MITIHHLGRSQSERIIWLCEELGVPYELKRYERTAVGFAPDEYKALYPFGTAPVITDGDVVLGESGAISDYVIARYGDGRLSVGQSEPGFADYLYWFHFANGSMMPSAMTDLVVDILGGPGDNEVVRIFKERSGVALAAVERQLGRTSYIAADELTAADILIHFPLKMMHSHPARTDQARPNINRYLQRLGERPAFVRAMARA